MAFHKNHWLFLYQGFYNISFSFPNTSDYSVFLYGCHITLTIQFMATAIQNKMVTIWQNQNIIKVFEHFRTTRDVSLSLLLLYPSQRKKVHVHTLLVRPLVPPVSNTLVNFIHTCLTYYCRLKVLWSSWFNRWVTSPAQHMSKEKQLLNKKILSTTLSLSGLRTMRLQGKTNF